MERGKLFLRRLHHCRKRLRLMDREFREGLSVERDFFVLQSFDERRVTESVCGERCVETDDPELAEGALLGLAVAVRITAGLHHGLIGFDEGL